MGKFISALLIGIVGSIAGGLATGFYSDLAAWLSPDKALGDYVLLAGNDTSEQAANEYLSLKSHGGEVWGMGKSGEKQRSYHGYLHTGNLVLAYRTNGANGIGFGDLLLEQRVADGSEFAGVLQGNFCPQHAVMRCPAVLVRGAAGGPEERAAREKYETLLARKCVPDEALTEAALAPCPKK
jgi:hypothetical protein